MMRANNTGKLLRLRPEEFRLLRDLVNAHAGLHFGDDALVIFDRRLSDRVSELQLSGFDEYYKYLRFNTRGPAELEEVVERLITTETYFFRQEYQLRAFSRELLPRLAESNRASRRISIWSAGCATGEEVYTLAILVHESGLFDGWEVRIFGSDISRHNVAFARRGIYRAVSFRTTSPEARRAHFEDTPEGARVRDSIRRSCHFGQLNLLDGGRASIVGRVDVVLCRNVLIYFDMRSRKTVIENLYDRLTPGGYLLLGHSESLLNVTTAFELVHLSEDLVYRRPVSTIVLGGTP
jgi:chemotaxis protein methyltransferase CheR